MYPTLALSWTEELLSLNINRLLPKKQYKTNDISGDLSPPTSMKIKIKQKKVIVNGFSKHTVLFKHKSGLASNSLRKSSFKSLVLKNRWS